MDEIKNIGYIYKITNKINEKCYVGQTSKFYKIRWQEHKRIAFKKEHAKYNYPLYKAFRKYGVDNFEFEIIEKCNIHILNQKEIYWISYFNSYNNGYNQDLGGGGKRILELDEDEIKNDYLKLGVINKVANKHQCSSYTIRNILHKNKIEIKSAAQHSKDKAFLIYQLDEEYNTIKIHKSLTDAGKWLLENSKINLNNPPYLSIRYAILTNSMYCGYYWQCNEYENKKEDYLNTIKTNKIKSKKIHKKTNVCMICGAPIYNDSIYCIDLPHKSTEIKKYSDEEWEKI